MLTYFVSVDFFFPLLPVPVPFPLEKLMFNFFPTEDIVKVISTH